MKKQKILAYEGRIPVSDRELTAAVIDIDNKKHLIIDLYIARTIKYRMAVNDKEYAHFNYEIKMGLYINLLEQAIFRRVE